MLSNQFKKKIIFDKLISLAYYANFYIILSTKIYL